MAKLHIILSITTYKIFNGFSPSNEVDLLNFFIIMNI